MSNKTLSAYLYAKIEHLWGLQPSQVMDYTCQFRIGLDFFLDNLHSDISSRELVMECAILSFPDNRREFFRCMNVLLLSREDAPMISEYIEIMGRDRIEHDIRTLTINNSTNNRFLVIQ